MIVVSSCSCVWPIHWSPVLSREWRCSWSSADRRCSNYIWLINNFIANSGVSYIRGLTVYIICRCYQAHVLPKWVAHHNKNMVSDQRGKKSVIKPRGTLSWYFQPNVMQHLMRQLILPFIQMCMSIKALQFGIKKGPIRPQLTDLQFASINRAPIMNLSYISTQQPLQTWFEKINSLINQMIQLHTTDDKSLHFWSADGYVLGQHRMSFEACHLLRL